MSTSNLYDDYVLGKQTLKQLSDKYNISVSTIQRRFKTLRSKRYISKDKNVIVHMDTTYRGKDFGVVVMRDSISSKVIWRKFICRKETVVDYREGIDWLKKNGFHIFAIVCDGLKGIYKEFKEYPIQMCQYHQIRIVRRYLTQSPELPAAIELLHLVNQITEMDKDSFISSYLQWNSKWKTFLKESIIDEKTKKKVYIHKRLRSANHSLKINMKYLWTWYDYEELNIPKTNNSLEGYFKHLKAYLNSHSGLSKEHCRIFIDKYIAKEYEK